MNINLVMSGSIEKTALFKMRLLPEHPKHERFPKPYPLGWGAHRVFDLKRLTDVI